MKPSISVAENRIQLRWGNLVAYVDRDKLRFAHLGCKLLGKANVSPARRALWDQQFGRAWRNDKDATKRLAQALGLVMNAAEVGGLVLWDTMRKGSDYWRPGNLLSVTADLLRQAEPGAEVSYEREDLLCPPQDLLEAFAADGSMTFGQYADGYAQHLRAVGAAEVAAAAILSALARNRLAVFYCVDPYVPGYAGSQRFLSAVPYASRDWVSDPELRAEGCHRVVLAEEVVRFFTRQGLSVELYEVDQTFGVVHRRRCEAAPRAPDGRTA